MEDGFKKLPKMQCFKEGGSIQPEMSKPKKAKEHKGVPAVSKKDAGPKNKMVAGIKGTTPDVEDETDAAPMMKKGGRTKKAMGTVRKYKDGGAVGIYGAKKSSGDKDSIQKAKDIKPKKAAAPSKAAVKPAMKGSDVAKEKSKPAADKDMIKKVAPTGDKKAASPSGAKEMANKYRTGGGVKKFADGLSTGAPSFQKDPYAAQDALDRQDNAATREMVAGPARRLKNYIAGKLSGLSPMNAAVSGVGAQPTPMQQPAPNMPAMQQQQPAPAMPTQKRGGKVKRK